MGIFKFCIEKMDIKIIIGNYEYSGASVESFALDKSAKNISHTFKATLGLPPFTSYKDYKDKMNIKNQQEITFYLNDVLFMAGIIEVLTITMEQNPRIELGGRSKMLCLVNGQGVIKEYFQRNLVDLIENVFEDNSVTTLTVTNKIAERLQTIPKGRILMKKEDTLFNFIDRYAIMCRCVAISDNEGNLLLTREGEQKNAVQGFDIQIQLPIAGSFSNASGINYTLDYSNSARFIEITSGSSTARFADTSATSGEKTKTTRIIEDEKITLPTRRRTEYNVSANGEVLMANSEWLLNRIRAERENMKVKILGDEAERFLGKNPELLQLIKVTNEYAMVENVFMVIAEIGISLSNDGLAVMLLLVPTGSYTFATNAKAFLKSLKNSGTTISQLDAPKLVLKLEPKVKELYYDNIDSLYKTQKIENFSAGQGEAIERVAFRRNIANKKYSK